LGARGELAESQHHGEEASAAAGVLEKGWVHTTTGDLSPLLCVLYFAAQIARSISRSQATMS